jgi:hypothetical protein
VTAKLKDVERVLAEGGFIRFTHRNCNTELIDASGQSQHLDGRTYDAFLEKHIAGLMRSETGKLTADNLVFEWRKSAK